MRYYLNTSPQGYEQICRSKNYVDKTGLIQFINERMEQEGNLILVSRPRRFGKTYAAQMLKAYYSYGYDTEGLFRDKIICQKDPKLSYRGAFDVIYIDMVLFRARAMGEQKWLKEQAKKAKKATQLDWIDFLSDSIIQELADAYGTDVVCRTLSDTMASVVRKTGRKFVWICDEWDNLFREPVDDGNAWQKYIELLRSLFKNIDQSATIFAAAYMTGILPMIKVKGESALTEFDNFTMFTPGGLAPYVGFTEEEVRSLLVRNTECHCTYEELALWYEGYAFPGVGSLFNPRSVMQAITKDFCESYWADTASNVQFRQLISLQRDTLRVDVENLLKGQEIPVSMASFDNDLRTLPGVGESGDSATLAAMVHLGYLAFHQETRSAYIPNREIRLQFMNLLKDKHIPND